MTGLKHVKSECLELVICRRRKHRRKNVSVVPVQCYMVTRHCLYGNVRNNSGSIIIASCVELFVALVKRPIIFLSLED